MTTKTVSDLKPLKKAVDAIYAKHPANPVRSARPESFPITVMAQSYGNWSLGYAWVDVSIGGGSVTGLALYARGYMKEPFRRVVGGLKEAMIFLQSCRVPARASGKFMAHVMAEDTARFLGGAK